MDRPVCAICSSYSCGFVSIRGFFLRLFPVGFGYWLFAERGDWVSSGGAQGGYETSNRRG
jgi:hypothetical protein